MEINKPENSGDHIQVGNITDSKAVAIGAGATAVYQGLSVEEVATLVVELKNQDQPIVWNGRTPYLGLTSFQESDEVVVGTSASQNLHQMTRGLQAGLQLSGR